MHVVGLWVGSPHGGERVQESLWHEPGTFLLQGDGANPGSKEAP